MKAKILTMTSSGKKDFTKTFKDLDSFNKYKEELLKTNCRYIKYSLSLNDDYNYTESKVEYGSTDIKQKKFGNSYYSDRVQKTSINNHIAVHNDKLINLSVERLNIDGIINSNLPLTTKEIYLLKSLSIFKILSVKQYVMLKEIKEKANRRIKIIEDKKALSN